MKALQVIIGILAMIAGVFCFCRPDFSILFVGFIVTVILLIAGIVGVIGYAKGRSDAKKGKFNEAAPGVGSLIFGIIALIFSLIALFSEDLRISIGLIIVIVFAVWLVVQGIRTIIMSCKMKNESDNGGWVAGLILGILLTLVAILAATNFFVSLFAYSFMLGIMLITLGINLMCAPVDGGQGKAA